MYIQLYIHAYIHIYEHISITIGAQRVCTETEDFLWDLNKKGDGHMVEDMTKVPSRRSMVGKLRNIRTLIKMTPKGKVILKLFYILTLLSKKTGTKNLR